MITYEFTEIDLKKYLIMKRRIPNIIFSVFGTILYFYFTFYLLLESPLEVICFYLLFILGFIFIIYLLDKLYYFINIKRQRNNNLFGRHKVKIDTDKIVVSINDKEQIYLNNDIKKIKRKKDYTIIQYKGGISLLFLKNILKENYNKIKIN